MSQKKEDASDKKPFTHPRWHEPIGGKVVGHKPLTEEEEKRAHEETLAVLKSMGWDIGKIKSRK